MLEMLKAGWQPTGLLEITDSPAGRQGQHHVLGPVERPEEERDVTVRVGEMLAREGVGEDHVARPPGRFPRCARQEESVRTLPVVGEIFDENIAGVQGVGLPPDVVVDVLEGSDFDQNCREKTKTEER